MAHYAPYGNAIYGFTAYGAPPATNVQTTMSVSPIVSPYLGQTDIPIYGVNTSGSSTQLAGLYNSLQIQWVIPGGNWNEIILVRSAFGCPVSPYSHDGVVLVDQLTSIAATPTLTNFYTDTNLQPGRFYYYSLFVYDTDIDEWLLSASAQGLCLMDWEWHTTFVDWTPDWLMEQDQLLSPPQPLDRFFQLLGFEMNWIRSEIESLFTLNSAEYISGAMLPWLGGNIGVDYEPALGMNQSRVLISNAVNLYKQKGTFNGVQDAATLYTGYPCKLTISPNQEIQLDDAAFATFGGGGSGYAYAGHWVPENAGTTIVTVGVENATYPVTPQHASYLPVQGPSGLATSILQQAGAAGYLPSTGTAVALVTATSAYGYTAQIQNTTVPPALYGAAAVYYPNNGTVVMFGGSASGGGGIGSSQVGTSQTWIFNGTYWNQAFPATVPPARYAHALAYDSQTGTVIMFGGNNGVVPTSLLNDTYSWNGTNWTLINPSTKPSARAWHAMAQDPDIGVVMFGGFDGTNYLSNTYRYSSGNWVLLSPVNHPTARAAHAMAYDSFEQATPAPYTGTVILFGGNAAGTIVNDTWIWSGTNWYNPTVGTAPGSRNFHAMGYDVTTDQIIMFGGISGGVPVTDTTWRWGGGSDNNHLQWQKLTESASNPSARYGSVMAWAGLGPMIMYGGYNSTSGVLSDSWLFNDSKVAVPQWLPIEGSQTPQPRTGAAMTYDAANSRVIMFGGLLQNGTYSNATWKWTSGGGWSQLTPLYNPNAVAWAGMCATTGSDIVLFGGVTTGLNYVATTYIWTGSNWAPITPAGAAPAARSNHTMVYDASAARCIIFGGIGNGGATTYDDMFYLTATATTWSSPANAGPPSGRWGHSMVYTTGGISILFGGYSGGYKNDTWQYNSASTGTWTQISPSTSPTARAGHAMVYDSAIPAVFIFDGTNGTALSDSWEFTPASTSGTWTNVNFGTPAPVARVYLSAVYDTAASEMLIYGGQNTGNTVYYGDAWTAAATNYGIYISECNSTNATTLGIPCVPGDVVVFSGYWQPVPAATPTIQTIYAQIDWYTVNGGLIDSVIGIAMAEVSGQWVWCQCTATAPANAYYFGRTFKSESTNMAGDGHLLDAVQSEINGPLATPGPTPWTPPRDLQLNFLPAQRNLIINGQGYAEAVATPGWSVPNGGTLIPVSTGPLSGTWPQDTYAGFQGTTYKPGFGDCLADIQTGMMATNPTEVYQASFFVQMDQTHFTATTASLTINWCSTDNPASSFATTSSDTLNFNSIGNNVTPAGQWGQVTIINATAPLDAYWAYITLLIETTSAVLTTTFWMAAPLFNEGLGTSYFDGTFSPAPDFSFEGQPFISPSDWYPNSETRLSRLLTIMPEYIPIGATYSIFLGQQAYLNEGLH